MDKEIREKIINKARKLINVNFVHQGRSDNGVDCIGLLINCFNSINENNEFNIKISDTKNYNQIINKNQLKQKIDEHFDIINKNEVIFSDLVVFKILKEPHHIGLIEAIEDDIITVIHSSNKIGKVVRQTYNKDDQSIYGFFRVKNEVIERKNK